MKNALLCRAFSTVPRNQAPLPGQPLGAYSLLTVDAHVQAPEVAPVAAPERVRVMVLPNTGPGALSRVQVIVPAPVAAVPVTANVQLDVVVVPPFTLVMSGAVPWLMVSSNGTFSALISANPAVTFDRA